MPFPFQATSKEGKNGGIELIQPPPGSLPGDRVYFEGEEFESWCLGSAYIFRPNLPSASTPLSQLNPKKKIFETIQPGIKQCPNDLTGIN
jgi:aminoacyl tRNA synthase complex-interacting multifunctional protein 1